MAVPGSVVSVLSLRALSRLGSTRLGSTRLGFTLSGAFREINRTVGRIKEGLDSCQAWLCVAMGGYPNMPIQTNKTLER